MRKLSLSYIQDVPKVTGRWTGPAPGVGSPAEACQPALLAVWPRSMSLTPRPSVPTVLGGCCQDHGPVTSLQGLAPRDGLEEVAVLVLPVRRLLAKW